MNIIYFIQKEILRVDMTTGKPMKIWCGNSEVFGYSEYLDTIEKKCKKLNKENQFRDIRYTIHEAKEVI